MLKLTDINNHKIFIHKSGKYNILLFFFRHTNNIFEALGEKLGILVCTAVASLASFTVALSYGWLLSLILLAIVPVVFIIGSLAIKVRITLQISVQEQLNGLDAFLFLTEYHKNTY